jgi:circadian clock protein KaiB
LVGLDPGFRRNDELLPNQIFSRFVALPRGLTLCLKKGLGMTPKKTTEMFDQALQQKAKEKYVLRLYVAGLTPRSQTAISNIKKISEEHLKGRYELEVIDVYRHPVLAKGEQIIAAPTLIKELPLPLRRFIGDLSDTERILLGLDLRPKKS